MKQEIENALGVLIGEPFRGGGRAANMPTYGFGDDVHLPDRRKGGTRLVSRFALHIQCPFRFVGSQGVIFGGRDMYYDAGPDPFLHRSDEEWAWHELGANRYDERFAKLMAEHEQESLVVLAVEADHTGSFRLQLSHDIALETFVDDSLPWEHWRFFRPGEEGEHFVVTGRGIGDYDE
jgi:hypothetical protein